MSPFLQQNGMDVFDRNEFGDDGDDYLINQIAETKEALEESKHLTDNEKLRTKSLLQDSKIESLKQTLSMKTKQLQELNEILKRSKAELGKCQNHRSYNFDVVAEVFKDTKKFSSKAGHEINQMLTSLGLEIEYDQDVMKIQKDGRWFKLGLDDSLKLTLVDMNPRHSRFDDIKILFDETRNISGLFSIYGWSIGE